MRNLPRLAFVLFTGTVAVIFCTLLLSPGFLAADKRSSASRKEQVSIRKAKEINIRSYPGLPDARQFARMVSLDGHLLGRGFTDEQVKCRTNCLANQSFNLLGIIPPLFIHFHQFTRMNNKFLLFEALYGNYIDTLDLLINSSYNESGRLYERMHRII